jgi:ribose 5-phosphate isomerase B
VNLSVKKLITENDVRQAARGNRRVEVEKGTIITPLAKDLAREKGVKFVEKVYKLPAFLEDSQQEVWPVTTVAIGSDHGGFYMKEDLKNYIKELGYKVHDVGTMSPNACDYPDIALQVAELVKDGKAERGVIIDGVGIGSAMVANRVPGVLAAKCNGCFEARSSREHNYDHRTGNCPGNYRDISLHPRRCRTAQKTGGQNPRNRKKVQITPG